MKTLLVAASTLVLGLWTGWGVSSLQGAPDVSSASLLPTITRSAPITIVTKTPGSIRETVVATRQAAAETRVATVTVTSTPARETVTETTTATATKEVKGDTVTVRNIPGQKSR